MIQCVGEIKFTNIKEVMLTDIPEPYTLYHLLSQTDAMISDYSSVYGDYLLTDKPIGFAFNDLEEYKKSRYIPLSPLEDYMPGMRINTKTKEKKYVTYFSWIKMEIAVNVF